MGERASLMSITDIRQVLGDGSGDPTDPSSDRKAAERDRPSGSPRRRHGRSPCSTLLVLFLIGFFLLFRGLPAFRSQGWHFFTNTGFQTQPTKTGPPVFGIRAALTGTIVTSVFAMIIGVPVALAAALFISEYAPARLKAPATSLIDLLAAVPSVVYGLWGFIFLSPHMVGLARWLSVHLSFIPFFHVTTPLFTSSQFIAGTILGLMVVPIVASISREVFSLTPIAEREAALALGASRATVIRRVVLPFGRGGRDRGGHARTRKGHGRSDRRGDHPESLYFTEPVPHPAGRGHHDRLSDRDQVRLRWHAGSAGAAGRGLLTLRLHPDREHGRFVHRQPIAQCRGGGAVTRGR